MSPSSFAKSAQQTQLAQRVDTRIGTAPSRTLAVDATEDRAGNVSPIASTPFGMVRLGPDTTHVAKKSDGESEGIKSYHYEDQKISGFSITHLSGAGCSNSGELPVLPLVGGEKFPKNGIEFSHDSETAQAGYYAVSLSNGVKVELTATPRVGVARFHFPATEKTGSLLLDTEMTATGKWGGQSHWESDHRLVGVVMSGHFCGTQSTYPLFFAIEFEKPVLTKEKKGSQWIIKFDLAPSASVLMKTALSYVSIKNAKLALTRETPRANFAEIKSHAQDAWDRHLGRILVKGLSLARSQSFYTALFHSMIHPNIFSDLNGEYRGFDGKTHNLSEKPGQKIQFANFSNWDMYRTQIQLLAVLFPKYTSDMVQSLVNDADQCGALPQWGYMNDDVATMAGDPAPAVIASAYSFGARGFELKRALEYMKNSATHPGTECNKKPTRLGLDEYLKLGFVPYELENDWLAGGSASVTLQYATSDFATAQMAQSLGDGRLSTQLLRQAMQWRKLQDLKTGWIRPRYSSGDFLTPFDPASQNGFVEGNSAQYSWMVPFDQKRVIDTLGIKKLDTFFRKLNVGPDLPHAFIGNEPSFGAPWVYLWGSRPDRTQAILDELMGNYFFPSPDGLPGNEDMGAMSAWYIWATLGLYPAIPGVGGFALSKPYVESALVKMGNGKKIKIQVNAVNEKGAAGENEHSELPGFPDAPVVIESMQFNKKSVTRSWIPWSELAGGGALDVILTRKASTWATQAQDIPPF